MNSRDIYRSLDRSIRDSISEREFTDMISRYNSILVDRLMSEGYVRLPYGLGSLHISKTNYDIRMVNGRVVGRPNIDWNKTNIERSNGFTGVVRFPRPIQYIARYSKNNRRVKGLRSYKFNISREIKKRVRDEVSKD